MRSVGDKWEKHWGWFFSDNDSHGCTQDLDYQETVSRNAGWAGWLHAHGAWKKEENRSSPTLPNLFTCLFHKILVESGVGVKRHIIMSRFIFSDLPFLPSLLGISMQSYPGELLPSECSLYWIFIRWLPPKTPMALWLGFYKLHALSSGQFTFSSWAFPKDTGISGRLKEM